MSSQKARAQSLLAHYIRRCAQGTWNFDSDNNWEVRDIVDCIIEAAVEQAKKEIADEVMETKIGSPIPTLKPSEYQFVMEAINERITDYNHAGEQGMVEIGRAARRKLIPEAPWSEKNDNS